MNGHVAPLARLTRIASQNGATMEIWPFIQQQAIPVITVLVTAAGAYFGARSYFLSERKKENEEIARIKQFLVGSSEVSVQNLTDVIESLRSRVDRLEADRNRIRNLLDEERDRARRLEEEKSDLVDEVSEGRETIREMKKEMRRLKRELEITEEELREVESTDE